MRGARIVKSVEADEGERMSEALVKQITGNETISARHLYQESFDFVSQFRLWLASN
jgi:putative DNA primase/helicase